MGTLTEGGNYVDAEGGLFIWAHELKRPQPSPDGNDAGEPQAGANAPLSQASFLPEDEQKLQGEAFGTGPLNPADPTNDA